MTAAAKSESNYQALLQELQSSKDHFQYIRKKDGKALDDALAQVAALQADLDAANSGWISVEDRLPEGLGPTRVLITANYLGDTFVSSMSYLPAYGGFGHYHAKVTYWKPLPNPPTDEEQNND